MKTTTIDPQSLAGMTNAQAAESALREMGCLPDPAHDRLWLVPAGKLRTAKRIARENHYPSAFKNNRAQSQEDE